MTPENKKIVIQCPSCSAKLQVGEKAMGKTIACPKCGHQMKIKDRPKPADEPIVARPLSSSSSQSNPPVAQPVSHNTGTAQSFIPHDPFQPAAPSDWSQLPMPPSAPSPYGQAARTNSASRGNGRLWLWIGLSSAGVILFGAFVSILAVWWTFKGTLASGSTGDGRNPASSGGVAPSSTPIASGGNASGANRDRDNPKIPFPSLGTDFPFTDKIAFYRVTIPRPRQQPLSLNIFIPKGTHADQSLPVMLEAPNGTNLLHGANIELPTPSKEYLPFTERGMITVTFSIDGSIPRLVTPSQGEIYFQHLRRAYKLFTEADAGVDSGKLALDYVLSQIPAADSKRVYMWGHSSSATLALLMASKDKRITKCIALAPITDLNARLGDLLTDRSVSNGLPGLKEYLVSGSPITHVGALKCPVFLAHARDDDNEPFQYSQAYVQALQSAGGNITFEARASGGHYQELIDASVPKALAWLDESR